MQDKPILTACTGKITVMNPVLISKGKLPRAGEKRFVQGPLKGISQRTDQDCSESEDRGIDTKDIIIDGRTLREIIPTLPFTLQLNGNLKPEDWKDMYQALQLHQILKDLFQWRMDNKRYFPGEEDFFQPKAERVRPNDTKAVGLGERSTKEPEIALNTSNRIRSLSSRHITPTQREYSVVTLESNINSNELWLPMSQFAGNTQETFANLQEINLRLEELTASQREIFKTLQEGYAKLSKAS
ncbi:hypothetical protein O181_106991 [Austropuccinia psidii MF-1]|uniref:Uncharacterized protein n=1 Tax=Austropuccinia psidii MF-1 TaxID=1389203 RepID=A0A9Q3PNQ8_9BASI|nr:hypothetical protein [Austropuccinia psidii MF-1]